jgi:hypothetical protein
VFLNVRSDAARAEDELFAAELFEAQLGSAGQRVRFRKHRNHAFVAQKLRPCRPIPMPLGNEGYVDRTLLDQRRACARRAFDDLDRNSSMAGAELLEQVAERRERHADADGQPTVLTTLQGLCTLEGAAEVIETNRGFFKESIARCCRSYTPVIPFKEVRADVVLEASDTPTNGRLLDIKGGRGAAKTAVLS